MRILAYAALALTLTGQSSAQPSQPDVKISGLEQRILESINNQRLKARRKVLAADSKLADIARAHSRDMATRNFFDHVNPAGQTPTERALASGYKCSRVVGSRVYSGISENIFQNNLYNRATTGPRGTVYDWNTEAEIAATTVDGWMKSAGHRSNILNQVPERTGVGVAISSKGKVYVTQVFC